MKVVSAKPRRHDQWLTSIVGCNDILNFTLASILVAFSSPLVAERIDIMRKGDLVATPHLNGWMIGPGIGLVKAGQGLKYLHALNTHLAVPSDVKASGCLCEIGIWEEGLHR